MAWPRRRSSRAHTAGSARWAQDRSRSRASTPGRSHSTLIPTLTASPIPTGNWAYSAAAAASHPYDPVAAARALDTAGWILSPGSKLRSKGGVPFRFDLVVASPFPNREIGDAVARQLLEIGIQADVKPVSSSDLVQKFLVVHNYQSALVR